MLRVTEGMSAFHLAPSILHITPTHIPHSYKTHNICSLKKVTSMAINCDEILPSAEWEEAADKIAYESATSSPLVCVVCGPANSGKTAFSRHLLNVLIHLYPKVAYMDTDVGQAEFTPPGCLSLTVIDEETRDLAVPCLRTPERCFFFGDATPRSDPKLYMAYVRALYDYYHEKYRQNADTIGVPLVVNTPGWVEGPGFDILVEMLNHIAPTQVVKIRVSAESKNLPPGAFWMEEGVVHEVTLLEIKSDRYDSLKKTAQAQNDARLMRDLRLLAYFRKCFPTEKELTTLDELDHGLAVHPPYEIPVSRVTIKQLHSKAPYTGSNNISTSRIVGLAISSSTPEDLPCCIGLGILKGKDTSKDVLYLITPIREHILKKVDLLLHGLIKIPDCLRQVQRHVASNTLRTN